MSVLEVERHGAVAVLRLHRPDRANSLNRALLGEIGRTTRSLAADDGVRAVVLTAAGDRIFCAGMDLKEFAEGGGDDPDAATGLDPLMFEVYPKPLIAAVNGAAVGGGFELVLCCDLVVAAEHARFGLPEVARGLVPGGNGTTLPSRIPLAVALELGLTGEPIDAIRALELGLVNRVVPAADVLPTALELAERIAGNGPLAVAAVKQLMWAAAGTAAWDRIGAAVTEVFASEDAREGAAAFAERREPRWQGR